MIKRKRYYGRRYGKGNDRLFKEQCFAASGPVYARSGQSEQFDGVEFTAIKYKK